MLSLSPQENDYQGITDEGKYDSMKGKVTGREEWGIEKREEGGLEKEVSEPLPDIPCHGWCACFSDRRYWRGPGQNGKGRRGGVGNLLAA